ncbi:hypothetical protein [Pseudomonas abyssi]|uniref:hypothetical protein n=1 Tax=Pseudomonas abyssi TaxID=170540 RepID=UPI00193113DB|nr:hypothetical protein [Halopseudomonas gallaeciensis]
MSLDYIRETYKVPAVLNGRVRYSGDAIQREGTIVGAGNAHLKVQLDGDDFAGNYHPTWKMEYLPLSGDISDQEWINAGCPRESSPAAAEPDSAGEVMVIKHQQQPCPVSCTSACIAMLSNTPVADVVTRFHDDYRASKIGFGHMLRELGVPYKAFMTDGMDAIEPAGAYLLTVPSLNLVAQNHSVVLEITEDWDWWIHDPVKGREGKRYYTANVVQCEAEQMLSSGYSIEAFVSMDDLRRIYAAEATP